MGNGDRGEYQDLDGLYKQLEAVGFETEASRRAITAAKDQAVRAAELRLKGVPAKSEEPVGISQANDVPVVTMEFEVEPESVETPNPPQGDTILSGVPCRNCERCGVLVQTQIYVLNDGRCNACHDFVTRHGTDEPKPIPLPPGVEDDLGFCALCGASIPLAKLHANNGRCSACVGYEGKMGPGRSQYFCVTCGELTDVDAHRANGGLCPKCMNEKWPICAPSWASESLEALEKPDPAVEPAPVVFEVLNVSVVTVSNGDVKAVKLSDIAPHITDFELVAVRR